MIRCRICGNESLCGVPLKREEQDWGTYTVSEVEVCKNCRCELCSDEKESWPGPGVQEANMVGIDCANLECKNPLCDCDPCMCTEEEPCLCCHMWDGESIVQSS